MALIKTTWAGAVAVVIVVCLTVSITPSLVEAQQPNNACALSLMPFVTNCFFNVTATPTEACCDSVKATTTTQVRCLCDGLVKDNEYANITQPFLVSIFNQCALPDKLSCSGTGAATKVSSMGVMALFASMFLMVFY